MISYHDQRANLRKHEEAQRHLTASNPNPKPEQCRATNDHSGHRSEDLAAAHSAALARRNRG